jgi:hypothetical protein
MYMRDDRRKRLVGGTDYSVRVGYRKSTCYKASEGLEPGPDEGGRNIGIGSLRSISWVKVFRSKGRVTAFFFDQLFITHNGPRILETKVTVPS